ncbi:hypothetical protein Cgig2_011439 [Carnegiea gigantea]|uniref:Probable magnesium transporter n=1 Tax=Carnegiea gigantea TaxID=171969 RepID=A0A9Q1KTW7_9CARY|nr:hypothetical protein Cgig2_011439 [Carnegiea gigantea]
MWEPVLLTLAATAGDNIGKVLQKKKAPSFCPVSLSSSRLPHGYLWCNINVSVIQPISGVGLAMLSIFSHFYLKELMNAVDWLGIALAGSGTIGVSAGGEEQKASPISILHLPWLGFFVAILFVFFNGWLHICRGQRKEQELMQFEFAEEVIYGLESGLKHGRAIVVTTCAAVASIVTGVLSGTLALGEHLPLEPSNHLLLLLGWLLITLGVIVLVSSSRLAVLVHWKVKRDGLVKSFSIKQSRSTRSRDPDPAAVIHTNTSHHLLTSCS